MIEPIVVACRGRCERPVAHSHRRDRGGLRDRPGRLRAADELGLFTEPLSAARGWDRETFAFAIALQNLLWGLRPAVRRGRRGPLGAGPGAGRGRLLYRGHRLMSLSTSGSALALTGGVLLGLGLAGGSFTIVLAAFARLVPEDRRSWSMGLATAAGWLGQFLFAPLGQSFIAGYGPLTALLLLSGFVALVPLLAVALTGRGEGGRRTSRRSPRATRSAAPSPTRAT